MPALSYLLDAQWELEAKFSDFILSLDRRRIITLSELIEDQSSLLPLQAPWINRALFVKRVRAAGEFFLSIKSAPGLPRRQRLVFFQAADRGEDATAHARKLDEEFFFREMCERRGLDVPPEAAYLHVGPMMHPRLTGKWGQRLRKIPPLGGFSNYGEWKDIYTNRPKVVGHSEVLGYQVPNYPELLGVSSRAATEYLARIVVHDLGHNYLPDLPPKYDSFHNAVMLDATRAQPAKAGSAWEEVVLRECTDKYFYLEGHTLLRALDETRLTPLQRYLLKRYRGWYDSSAHHKNRGHLWRINPEATQIQARQQLDAVVTELRRKNFEQYTLLGVVYKRAAR